jgi:very-short-patch-repair endonuclease
VVLPWANENMSTVHNLKINKKKRQYLRNNATKAEKILWQKLKNSRLGYKFRRQHSIKEYITDFYCPKLKLIIEIDGDVHGFKK